MADILIRNLKMPSDCGDCYLCHGQFCYALKKLRFNKDYRERPESCPLVELPEHGELVDLDAVVDCQYYDDMYEEWSIRTVTVRDVLYGCLEAMPPVVIPASSSKLHEEGRE